MTEDEAKTAWCPFARVNNGSGNNANRDWEGRRDSAFNTRSRCIGSACMAWRWRLNEYVAARAAYEVANKVVAGSREAPKLTGFCGLAGRPE